MTIDEFRNNHSISNLINDPRYLPDDQKIEYWCLLRRKPIKGIFKGVPSGTSFGCMLIREQDTFRVDVIDINDTAAFKLTSEQECTCGANHTSFPQQHYKWCRKYKG